MKHRQKEGNGNGSEIQGPNWIDSRNDRATQCEQKNKTGNIEKETSRNNETSQI